MCHVERLENIVGEHSGKWFASNCLQSVGQYLKGYVAIYRCRISREDWMVLREVFEELYKLIRYSIPLCQWL